MEEIQNTRKSLLRRIAMATVAMGAVVGGLGMAPAGADVQAESEAEFEAETSVEFHEGMHAITSPIAGFSVDFDAGS